MAAGNGMVNFPLVAYLAKSDGIVGYEVVLVLTGHDAGHTARATGGIENKGILSHESSP
jgi:nucleoside-diphosphate-sugar epimerase